MISKAEIIGLMQSDMKMWDSAATKDLGDGKIMKTIVLPYGIGETTVTLEGITDAGKRRNAVAGYGEYIRGLIDEQINDEVITSRAQQAAQEASERASSLHDTDGVGGVQRAPVPREETVPSHGEIFIPTRETIGGRLDELERQLRDHQTAVRVRSAEIAGLRAYKGALDAQEIQTKTPTDSVGEDDGAEAFDLESM